MTKLNPIIQWWMVPELPVEHIFIPREKRPKEVNQIVRVYFRKWFVHPIKRRVARYYLLALQKFFDLKVIGITGSCGKTTTKEMAASILTQKGKTVASYANIDPVYNIPTTILKCRPSTKYLILEMGVEFPGEMDFYLWLAKPVIGVVTNIYPTHTEFFGNVEGVAKEKVKLVAHLPKEGHAILNSEDAYEQRFSKKSKAKVFQYGKKGEIKALNQSTIRSLKTKFTLVTKKSKISVLLPVLGSQFVSNAIAAASVGHVLGISLKDVKRGLEGYKKPKHRMNPVKLRSGALLIDDSYNNNPEAARGALFTFRKLAGKKIKIVVFGDMLELGKHESKYHRQLGKFIASLGTDYLIGVGKASKMVVSEAAKSMNKNQVFWAERESLVDPILKPLLKRNSAALIKGSRSIGLDRLVSRLS